MNLILWGLLAFVSANRPVEEILSDLKSTHVQSREFQHQYLLKSNENSLHLESPFHQYDVYTTTNDTDEEFGQLEFDIPLGDIPELRGDFFTTINNTTKTDDKITHLIIELQSIDSPSVNRLLGDIYAFGHYGVQPSVTLSHDYYQRVISTTNDANTSNEDLNHSHFMLGVFYHTGVLGHHEQSHAKGLIHYEIAEDLGSKQAAMALGHMYQYGIGVLKNHDVALFYYTKLFNYIEDSLDPLKTDLQLENGTVRDLINNIHFDRFSFRVSDLFGGVFPDSVSFVRSSLRMFETKEMYLSFRENDNQDDDSLLPQGELILNNLLLDLYIKTQAYYKGDYLHSRDYERSMGYALEAYDLVKEHTVFQEIIKGGYRYDKPEWVMYIGRILLYMSHMSFRGDVGKEGPNYELSLKYSEMAKQCTSTKLFSTDYSNTYMYGLGGIERDFKKGQRPMLENRSISQTYHYLMSNLDLLNDELVLEGKTWSVLSYVASYDFYLGERAMIKFWLEGAYKNAETGEIVQHLANYIKLFEPMFFNFRETFMASINGDMWKALMGLLVQSELGYEYAQNTLGMMLFPTIGAFSDKEYRFDPKVHADVFTGGRYLEAVKFLEISTMHGNPDTMNHLGDLYYWGLPKSPRPLIGDYNIRSMIWPNSIVNSPEVEMIVPSNPLRSVSLYHDACNSGSHQGCFNLGWVYEFGIGVTQDLHLSKRYYDLAMTKSQVGFIGIKLSLWRIWLKVKIWDFIGFDVTVPNVKLGWSGRLFKLINWDSLTRDEL